MQIQVETNPNCGGSEQYLFSEIEAPRRIRGLKIMDRGQCVECDVVGVEDGARFVEGHAVKITDSGAGFAYLIYGGRWGIRLRPCLYAQEAWSLENKHQWGEAFKIYGSREDIVYADD